jgi:hypothetical protein
VKVLNDVQWISVRASHFNAQGIDGLPDDLSLQELCLQGAQSFEVQFAESDANGPQEMPLHVQVAGNQGRSWFAVQGTRCDNMIVTCSTRAGSGEARVPPVPGERVNHEIAMAA